MDDITVHGTIPGPADHEGVFVSFMTNSSKPKPCTIVIYDYDNTNISGLNDFLDKVDFQGKVFSFLRHICGF